MNKLSLAILLSLSGLAGFANAQSGITESTDPAKIAAIEQRARELGNMQPAATAAMPMEPMHHGEMHHGKKHHGKKHHAVKHHGDMDHGKMHHGKMDHVKMDHGKMRHPARGALAAPAVPVVPAPAKP